MHRNFSAFYEAFSHTLFFFLAATGFLFIVLKSYDYFLIKKEAQARKGMGDFSSYGEWKDAVREKCLEWARDMPQVQISDNMNFVMLEKISGRYSKDVLQAWQKGGILLGLGHYLKSRPDDPKTAGISKYLLEEVFNSDHDWKAHPGHIDYAILAYALMKLPDYNPKYNKAMDRVMEVILDHLGEDGTVCYRKDIENYRLVDTIGMICPFLIRYGVMNNKQEPIDLAIRQIEKYSRYGVHAGTNIPAHAYHVKNKVPMGIFGWGRGVGWYALGLIDSYEELTRDHPKKGYLRKNIALLAESLIKFQRPDGGWGHSFFMDDNIYDSSATSMALYFLKKSLMNNIISGEVYIKALDKGMLMLERSTRKDGTVDYSQGDTKGIGTYSTLFREMPFTQGIVLALLEMT